ncbi:MAG: peptide deformylase [Candidatus Paceibacterota bacterium]|jgi:peptide deformylase
MNEIVQQENKILRKISKAVPIASIKSTKIASILERMTEALDKQEDGVAIAAPQIGENLRIFIVSKKIFEIMDEEKTKTKISKKQSLNELREEKPDYKNMVFINPEILKTSKKQMSVEEGCLSVRWFYGKVKRSEKTLVRAYDENGKLFTLGGSGLLSQAFQHEIDHLDGILFIDKATGLKEMVPDKNGQNK